MAVVDVVEGDVEAICVGRGNTGTAGGNEIAAPIFVGTDVPGQSVVRGGGVGVVPDEIASIEDIERLPGGIDAVGVEM